MRATAKDLRFHAGALLDTVSRGEEITITYRGAPRARLVPVKDGGGAGGAETFGMWRDRRDIGEPGAYVRSLRRGRSRC
jgi:prevent-host-death family protein